MLADKNLKGFILLEMAIVYFIELILVMFSPSIIRLGNSAAAQMFLMVAVCVGMTGAACVTFFAGRWKDTDLGFSRKKMGKQLLIGLAIAGATVGVGTALSLLSEGGKNDLLRYRSLSWPVLLFYLFFAFWCVGFGEEIVFRGYFYSRAKNVFSAAWLPMLLSAVLFGLLRYPATLSMASVVSGGAAGLLYGGCRWKIKDCSLLSVGLAHGLHEAALVLLAAWL
ncbi:MAG: CPBP family intramembrane metalloprotease [Clostridium sp.]|jgi:membrane protease YdiL (CAAX protease family)|nr:CPBP family intramembrane metalloprotease [Clostridium sp.]